MHLHVDVGFCTIIFNNTVIYTLQKEDAFLYIMFVSTSDWSVCMTLLVDS